MFVRNSKRAAFYGALSLSAMLVSSAPAQQAPHTLEPQAEPPAKTRPTAAPPTEEASPAPVPTPKPYVEKAPSTSAGAEKTAKAAIEEAGTKNPRSAAEAPSDEMPAKPAATAAELPPPPFPMEKTERVLWRSGGEEIGARSWGATTDAEGHVVTAETVVMQYWDRVAEFKGLNDAEMPYKKQKYSWRSEVHCGSADHAPEKAWVETRIGGWPIMRAEITLRESGYNMNVIMWRDQTGKRLDPPTKFSSQGELPAGLPILFQSEVARVGPELLPEAGQKSIIFAEFPDDMDEPVLFKAKHSLVREATDNGGFLLRVAGETSTKMAIYYDADGELVRENIGQVAYVR